MMRLLAFVSPWIQWDVWAKNLGPLWTTFVPQLSVWQRNVLGFPKPGKDDEMYTKRGESCAQDEGVSVLKMMY